MSAVKYFHAQQAGSPTLTGIQGSLISVLDACLVNGFGLKSVESIVVAGNIATVMVSTGHAMEPDILALIEGATPSSLNGEKRVLSSTATTFTFAAAGISDQTASGTITTKVAPLGWEKVFSATHKAVYRPSSVEGTRMFLRVDETVDGREARVRGFEHMTDVDTGVGAFPTTDQLVTGALWPKASVANANQRDWTIIGDHRTLYLHLNCVDSVSSSTGFRLSGSVWTFGDFKSFKAADPYACLLQGATSTGQYGSGSGQDQSVEFVRTDNNGNPGQVVPRNYTGVSGASQVIRHAESLMSGNGAVSGSGAYYVYPNGPDNGLLLVGTQLIEYLSGNAHLRGRTRGVYRVPQNCHASFAQRTKIDGTGDLTGRKLLAIKCGSPNSASSQAVLFFDITGPWEA